MSSKEATTHFLQNLQEPQDVEFLILEVAFVPPNQSLRSGCLPEGISLSRTLLEGTDGFGFQVLQDGALQNFKLYS